MSIVDTEVLVIGSGAGGSTTALALAEAGRSVLVVEEGPDLDGSAVEPFSLREMELAYRHRGSSAALGSPPIAYAEGRCVGGSTEVNSGLWHRLPEVLADEWRVAYGLDEFTPEALHRYAERVEEWVQVSTVPEAPRSSALIAEGAQRLGWRWQEFPRAFAYDQSGRGTKQSMARTLLPRARAGGASVLANTAVRSLRIESGRALGARCSQTQPDGGVTELEVRADQVVVCGGAVQSPALLQRSGVRRGIGAGLKMHPTVKVAARFPEAIDHGDVPMHRITEFSPHIAIGGSASRRGHVGLAVADSGADVPSVMDDWEHIGVYYAAIRSDRGGRVISLPGLRSPLVTYRLTDADLSRLARGLVLLGESLFAAGATELYPSIEGMGAARSPADLASWWDALDRSRCSLMTVHLTSSIRMSSDPTKAGTDSFGRVWGIPNLRVNDASLLADAPGVNPQAAIMAIALRNADHMVAIS